MKVQLSVSEVTRALLYTLLLIGISFPATVAAIGSNCVPAGEGSSGLALPGDSVINGCPDPSLSCASFTTVEAAVIDAFSRYNPCSIHSDTEYLGAVLYNPEPGAGYRYTVGAGNHGEDNIRVRIRIPHGYSMVAFWHTHGKAHWSHAYFSATDTALVERWQVPLYLANYSGRVRKFEPGSATISRQEARRLGLGNRSGYANGAPVLSRIHY
jgi:hypothetical protein